MAEEVKIRITADDQATKPVLDAVRAEQEFGLAAQQAGELSARAAVQQSASKQDLRARLEELVRAQDAYLQSIREGATIDQSEVAIAEAREDQIRRITDELGREVNIQAEMTRRVREAAEAQRAATQADADGAAQSGVSAEATDRASQRSERRGNSEQRLRDRLRELIVEQDRAARLTSQGTQADAAAEQAAERRARMIERIAARLRERDRIESEMSRAIRGATQATVEADGATGSLAATFGLLRGAAGSLFPVLTGAGSILAAYQAIVAELRLIVQLQDKAFKENVTVASAERTLKLNMPGASDSEYAKMRQTGEDLSRKYGVPLPNVLSSLADAMSSTGGDQGRSADLVGLALQIRPDQPERAPVLAGAIGDTSNAIGTRDNLVGFGYLQTVAGLSRVVGARGDTTIPQAVTGAMGNGFSRESAGSMFAAISNRAADRTGEMTRTAQISLSRQINAFFESLGRSERGDAAIAALQADSSLRAEFLSKASFEAAADVPSKELLTPGTATYQSFIQFRSEFGDDAALRRRGLETIRRLNTGPSESIAQAERAFSTTAAGLSQSDLGGAMSGAVRSKLKEVLQTSGEGALASKLDEILFEGSGGLTGEDALEAAYAAIDKRTELLRRPTEVRTVAGPGGIPRAKSFYREPTAREREIAERLDELKTTISGLISRIEQQQGAVNVTNMYVNGEPRLTSPTGRLD
jgi:hypothetical protein